MKKTTKRLYYAVFATLSLAATAVIAAAPAIAGTRLNHSEPLISR